MRPACLSTCTGSKPCSAVVASKTLSGWVCAGAACAAGNPRNAARASGKTMIERRVLAVMPGILSRTDARCSDHAQSDQRIRPARTGKAVRPITFGKTIHAHALAGGRRMDETAFAEVDAHMRDALAASAEEHQVAGLQVVAVDHPTVAKLRSGIFRQIDAQHLREDVMHEAAAIKA